MRCLRSTRLGSLRVPRLSCRGSRLIASPVLSARQMPAPDRGPVKRLQAVAPVSRSGLRPTRRPGVTPRVPEGLPTLAPGHFRLAAMNHPVGGSEWGTPARIGGPDMVTGDQSMGGRPDFQEARSARRRQPRGSDRPSYVQESAHVTLVSWPLSVGGFRSRSGPFKLPRGRRVVEGGVPGVRPCPPIAVQVPEEAGPIRAGAWSGNRPLGQPSRHPPREGLWPASEAASAGPPMKPVPRCP